METLNSRPCIVPSDIVEWVFANKEKLIKILWDNSNQAKEITNTRYEKSALKTHDEYNDARKSLNKVIDDNSINNLHKKTQTLINRILAINPQETNIDLIKDLFYDQEGDLRNDKILRAINNNDYRNTLDWKYIQEQCKLLYSDSDRNKIQTTNLYQDKATKYLFYKEWGGVLKVFDQYKEEIEAEDTIRFIYGKYWLPSSELLLTKNDTDNTAYIIGNWITYTIKSNIEYWKINEISYEEDDRNEIDKGLIKIRYKWEKTYQHYKLEIKNEVCYISEHTNL
jgi:hypothetical protein